MLASVAYILKMDRVSGLEVDVGDNSTAVQILLMSLNSTLENSYDHKLCITIYFVYIVLRIEARA